MEKEYSLRRSLKDKLSGGKFGDVSAVRSKSMGAVRGKGNKSTEIRLKMALVRAGIRGWKLHDAGIPGKPDFYFSGNRLAIFVDGCFWHGHNCGRNLTPRKRAVEWKRKIARNKTRDARLNRVLRSQGWRVLRIHECTLSKRPAACILRINRLLKD